MMKKKMLPPFLVPITNPFAYNSAGFSGIFPGSSPDLIGAASRPSISFLFPASICLGAGLFFASNLSASFYRRKMKCLEVAGLDPRARYYCF